MSPDPVRDTALKVLDRPIDRSSLLEVDRLEAFLDREALQSGPVIASQLQGGHSNVTFLVSRGDRRFALRRPPLGPLPPSAHDVLREARVLRGLERSEVPAPRIIAVCEDTSVLGAPFYLMDFLDGVVLSAATPRELAAPAARSQIAEATIDALAALHRADPASLREVVRPGAGDGYLTRQLQRFAGLWERGRTRELPALDAVTRWLQHNMPEPQATTIVHGDYRIGNLMFAADRPVRLLGVLDWEMATLGDPLADLGYLTAHWASPATAGTVMRDLQPVTREPGFPDSGALADRYREITGRGIENLAWYEVLATWKAAIFLEQSYGRFLAGNAPDPWFGELGAGVPGLVDSARERAGIGARRR